MEERDRLHVRRRVLGARTICEKRALLGEGSFCHAGHERDERRRVGRHPQRVVDDRSPDHQAEEPGEQRKHPVPQRRIEPGSCSQARTLTRRRGERPLLLICDSEFRPNPIDLQSESLHPLLGVRDRSQPLALMAPDGHETRLVRLESANELLDLPAVVRGRLQDPQRARFGSLSAWLHAK